MRPTLEEIYSAHQRIASGIHNTPCDASPILSSMYGANLFTKKEFLQETGSFKERGARNALLLLSDEQKAKGVVAQGSHAVCRSSCEATKVPTLWCGS
jgi:threonine dehydratase